MIKIFSSFIAGVAFQSKMNIACMKKFNFCTFASDTNPLKRATNLRLPKTGKLMALKVRKVADNFVEDGTWLSRTTGQELPKQI